MKNKISDLRNHLFATLEALQDETKPMDIARAKAVSDVAQTIINSAKVEIEFFEATAEIQSEFFHNPLLEAAQPRPVASLPEPRRA